MSRSGRDVRPAHQHPGHAQFVFQRLRAALGRPAPRGLPGRWPQPAAEPGLATRSPRARAGRLLGTGLPAHRPPRRAPRSHRTQGQPGRPGRSRPAAGCAGRGTRLHLHRPLRRGRRGWQGQTLARLRRLHRGARPAHITTHRDLPRPGRGRRGPSPPGRAVPAQAGAGHLPRRAQASGPRRIQRHGASAHGGRGRHPGAQRAGADQARPVAPWGPQNRIATGRDGRLWPTVDDVLREVQA